MPWIRGSMREDDLQNYPAWDQRSHSDCWNDILVIVGGFNPFEKYARQIGSFPQVGVNIKKK